VYSLPVCVVTNMAITYGNYHMKKHEVSKLLNSGFQNSSSVDVCFDLEHGCTTLQRPRKSRAHFT